MKPDPFEIVGTMLDGRYRIDEVVGEGGFGVVYRAFHPGFDAPIAIKVLKMPPGLKAEEREELLATFHQEGKLLFTLSKLTATFVQVMEKGVLQRHGRLIAPYLVLEWLDGKTLDAELRERRARGQGRYSLDEVIALLDPIAEALALAHTDWKVAHRDVKPENIFLVRGARGAMTTKLLDFGIAKVMTSTGSAALNDPTLRGGGGFTPQYAAPEQWNRKYGHTGPWSDVYALALVCVELLAGKPALEADELGQLFGATIDPERPTPSRRGVPVPPQVEQVFLAALAVKPHERYREMRSFWDALEAAKTDRMTPAPPATFATPPPRSEPVVTTLALAPTQLLPAASAPPAGSPAQMVRGRGPMLLSVVGAALALVALSAGVFLLRRVSPSQEPSETPGADPTSEAPSTSISASWTARIPATVSGVLSEPSGAPAASSAQAPVPAGSNDCQQRSDCKDGKKCVRGVCRHAECTEDRDCSGPKVCNKSQNKCEWSVRVLPGL